MASPDDPHAHLAALAETARAEREAAAARSQAQALRRRQAEAAAVARHQRLMSWTTWSSLSRCMSLVWIAPAPLIVALFPVGVMGVLDVVWVAYAAGFAAACLVVAVLGTLWARARDLAFRARLPYATPGYAAVLGRPARSVRCVVAFAGAPPDAQTFADLLRRVGMPTRLLEVRPGELEVLGEPHDYSLLDDHCRWMPRWFRRFERRVLRPVHAAHPIRAVHFH